jgi:hypothetical protein
MSIDFFGQAASNNANSDCAETHGEKGGENDTISNSNVSSSASRTFPIHEEDSSITFRTFTNNGSDESSAALISLKVRVELIEGIR